MKKTLVSVLFLSFLLCAIPVMAEGALKAAAEAVQSASTVDAQLELLYDTSMECASELEIGGWEDSLTCDPAQPLPEDLLPGEEMEDAELSVQDFEGAKFIAIYDDEGSYRLLGDWQVRIPQTMRAASLAEADAVLCLVHTTRGRDDYIGSAYDRIYDAWIYRRGSDVRTTAFHITKTPPVSGYGTLSGEHVSLSDLWNGVLRWFYDVIEVSYPQGTASYRITGQTCCLAGLDGEFTRYEIPEEVEGYPVVGIEECSNDTLEELVLPEGIAWIQRVSGINLHRMNFPSTLRRITDYVSTEHMDNVLLNEGLEEIGDFALLRAHGEDFFLPSTLKSMGRGTLEYGAECPFIIVPDGMTALQDYFLNGSYRVLCAYIPESVKSFGSSLFSHGTHIFAPEGSSAAVWAANEGYRWTACESPEDMPRAYYGEEDGFEYGIIGDYAVLTDYFGDDEDVLVPETLGGCPVTYVQSHAFYGNNIVRSIEFPNTVTRIASSAIEACTGLERLYIPASVEDYDIGSYVMEFNLGLQCTLYVSADSPLAQICAGDETIQSNVWEPDTETPASETAFAFDDTQIQALSTPGATVEFGRWQYDEGSEEEPAEWIVLAVESDRSLLVAKKALGTRRFDDSDNHPTYMSWPISSVRAWLQTECFDTMFTRPERAVIAAVRHDECPEKIFLLSAEEAESLFDSDAARQYLVQEDGENTGKAWWLRSSGTKDTDCLAVVSASGEVYTDGQYFGAENLIRPAIWVKTR